MAYQWLTSALPATYQWLTSGLQVAYQWLTSSLPVVYQWLNYQWLTSSLPNDALGSRDALPRLRAGALGSRGRCYGSASHDALGSRDALPRLRAPFGQLSRRRVGQPHALLRLRITTRWAAATIAMDAGLELQPLAESCNAIVVYTGTC